MRILINFVSKITVQILDMLVRWSNEGYPLHKNYRASSNEDTVPT